MSGYAGDNMHMYVRVVCLKCGAEQSWREDAFELAPFHAEDFWYDHDCPKRGTTNE